MRIRVTGLLWLVLLSGCASDASLLCDERLVPINVPAAPSGSMQPEKNIEQRAKVRRE